ncbi:MAG: hypothetical protein KJ832_09025, partial [Gammaproteobacteria bacterium]|nr:hypothetical protein [Gammaproteobacteria bacterium]
MDPLNVSLFDAQSPESPAALASALAPLASPGHFDELRGIATPVVPAVATPRIGTGATLSPAPLHD